MSKVKITGFWTFFCNPKYWAVDNFLLNAKRNVKGQYRICSWQKQHFAKGQFGIIRVGIDVRSKRQLDNRPKLERGIYGIVEITGPAIMQSKSGSDFKIKDNRDESGRFVVPIKYIRNYIHHPLLFSEINKDYQIQLDPYLLKGIQAASMPLLEETFNRILLYREEP